MMVQKLTTHMGKTGLIGSDNYKFKQQQSADKTWKKAKKWYRDALAKLKSINEEAGPQTTFTANNVTLKTAVEEQAKADISRKLGECLTHWQRQPRPKQKFMIHRQEQ